MASQLPRPIRLLLAEAAPLQRTGLRLALPAEAGFDLVAEVADGRAAVESARRLQPDVAILGAGLPKLDEVAAALAILDGRTGVRVLLLVEPASSVAAPDPDERIEDALLAGASGFLTKDAPAAQLASAVHSIAAGIAVLAPQALQRLLARSSGAVLPGQAVVQTEAARVWLSLTSRERQVLTQLAQGRSNIEIAQALSVSEPTVKTHVRQVLRKLGVRDRVQAVVCAYETGLVANSRG